MPITFEYYNDFDDMTSVADAFQLDGNVKSINEEWINSIPRDYDTVDEYLRLLSIMKTGCKVTFSFSFTEFVPGLDLLPIVYDKLETWKTEKRPMLVVVKFRNNTGRVYKTIVCKKLLDYSIDSYVVTMCVDVIGLSEGDDIVSDEESQAGPAASPEVGL